MTADADPAREDRPEPDYRTLPPQVRLDDTNESVDPGPVPEPEAGRNLDQHRALRDD
ncbi:hypothetical protein [Nocardioides pakistanensis]